MSMRFEWLAFVFMCVWLARDLGLPPKLGQVIAGVLLLLMLLVLLGVVMSDDARIARSRISRGGVATRGRSC